MFDCSVMFCLFYRKLFASTMTFKLTYFISVLSGVVEAFCFAGITFGWSSISTVFRSEGYFRLQCSNQTDSQTNSSTSYRPQTCPEQEQDLILVVTLAGFVLKASTVPLGVILDRLGTLVTRFIGTILVTAGTLMISVSVPSSSYLLHYAMCCNAVGGIFLLYTLMPLGNLFPSHRSLIITLINGAMDSSAAIFLFVKIAWDFGFSVHALFTFIAACTAFIWFRTLFLMPVMHVPFDVPLDFHLGVFGFFLQKIKSNKSEYSPLLPQNSSEDLVRAEITKHSAVPYSVCLRTPEFWLNMFHIAVLGLRMDMYISQAGTWLKSLSIDEAEFDSFINTFGTMQLLGICCAPLNGVLLDRLIKAYSGTNEPKMATRKAISVSLMTSSTLAVVFSVLTCIDHPVCVYMSFVFSVLFRAFLYGGNASFITLTYPCEHFGKLMGLTMVIGGIVSLLQYPLSSLILTTMNGDFQTFNVYTVFACLITVVHPVSLRMRT